jgi:hypothetical protein
MQKRPDKSPAPRPVYAVISLEDLLKVEHDAAAAGLSVAEAVRTIIVEQLLRTQSRLTVH